MTRELMDEVTQQHKQVHNYTQSRDNVIVCGATVALDYMQ